MKPEEIAKLFERAADHGIPAARVSELVAAGKGAADLDVLIVEAQRTEIAALKSRKPAAPAGTTPPDTIGAPAIVGGNRRAYSLMNVIRSLSGMKADIGFEREISDELAKQRGEACKGILVPHFALARRDLTVAGTSSATVATDLRADQFIDLLRNKSILGQAGVQFLTGLVGNLAIPKMTAGSTGYWVAESGAITESAPTIGQVTGSPHTVGAMVDISRRLLIQSTPSAEDLVRNDIVETLIRKIQVAVFAGTGADGEPSAITNATGINNPSVTQGTPTYAEILGFPGAVMADSAEADGQKFLMTAEVWAKLAATAVASNAPLFVVDYASKTCLGYPYLMTEDLPANSLWFGNWATVVVGVWGNGIDINVDTATLSSSGGVRLVGLQDVDVMVREGKALAYNTAVTS